VLQNMKFINKPAKGETEFSIKSFSRESLRVKLIHAFPVERNYGKLKPPTY
jgi:hypothetical protein